MQLNGVDLMAESASCHNSKLTAYKLKNNENWLAAKPFHHLGITEKLKG